MLPLFLFAVSFGFLFNGVRMISDLFSSLVTFFTFVLGTLIPFLTVAPDFSVLISTIVFSPNVTCFFGDSDLSLVLDVILV